MDMPIEGGKTPWHCADIPFFFHNTELVPVSQAPGVTSRVEEEIFRSVMAFAHTGDPNNDAIDKWPASTPQEEHTMVFGKQSGVRTNFDAELIPALAKYMGPVFAKMMAHAHVQH